MTINYNGKLVQATRVKITARQEQPNIYTLDNGTQIHVQTFLVDALRLDGEFDQHGNQVYHVNWQVNPTVYPQEDIV